jgi:hypothetical protein
MQRYQTDHWQRVKASCLFEVIEPDFVRYLREVSRPAQIAFQKLMSMSDGNPVGIECKSSTRAAWAFVMPNIAGDSDWKVQYFDEDGFSGHCCHATIVKAAEAMISEGYVDIDAGILEKVTTTNRWALGVQRLQLRDWFNQGLISYREMLAGFKDLEEAKAA